MSGGASLRSAGLKGCSLMVGPCPSRVPHLSARSTAPVPIRVLHGGLSLHLSRRDHVSRRTGRAVDGGRCCLRGGLHRLESGEFGWCHPVGAPLLDTHWPVQRG